MQLASQPGCRLAPITRCDPESAELLGCAVLRLQINPGLPGELRVRLDIEVGGRHHPIAVPEVIEHFVGLARDVAKAEQIEIVEVVIMAEAEIMVADVAATDDGRIAIGY